LKFGRNNFQIWCFIKFRIRYTDGCHTNRSKIAISFAVSPWIVPVQPVNLKSYLPLRKVKIDAVRLYVMLLYIVDLQSCKRQPYITLNARFASIKAAARMGAKT